MSLIEKFLSGTVVLKMHNKYECEDIIDFAKSRGFYIGDLNKEDYLEYPYFFIENKEQLQAAKYSDTIYECTDGNYDYREVFDYPGRIE